MVADKIFSMYPVKHANVIQVTRNADLDMYEESDEYDEDFRSHMKRILKKRSRLAPVRLESERPLSDVTERFLAKRLELKRSQIYAVGLPLDMGYAFEFSPSMVRPKLAESSLTSPQARNGLPTLFAARASWSRSRKKMSCFHIRMKAWTRLCTCCKRPPRAKQW